MKRIIEEETHRMVGPPMNINPSPFMSLILKKKKKKKKKCTLNSVKKVKLTKP